MAGETEREVVATPRARRRFERPWSDVAIAGAVILVLSSPVLFTNRVFAVDTTNALWLGSIMRQSLSHGVPPSLFISTGHSPLSGVFNPLFAFYGGSLFAVFGALIAMVGISAAYIVLVVLSFAAAYGGTLWFSRQVGLRGLLAHIPAFAVVSSAYFLTNLYGRGDIPEFVALSVIPLFVAAAVHEVRAPRSTATPTVLLVVSAFFFTGSHNLTLLWGTLIGAASLAVLAAFVRPRRLSLRRLSVVAAIVALATMVNGWFLLPDVAFGKTTHAMSTSVPLYAYFDRFSVLFYPGRAVPPLETGSPALYVQAPIYFLVWSLVCGAWIWKSGRMPLLRRMWTAVVVLLVGVFLAIMVTPFWGWAPATLRSIQFPYRLNGYVLLFVAGLVLVSLLAVQGELVRRRGTRLAAWLLIALAPVIAISAGLAVWQIWVPKSCGSELLRREPLGRSDAAPRATVHVVCRHLLRRRDRAGDSDSPRSAVSLRSRRRGCTRRQAGDDHRPARRDRTFPHQHHGWPATGVDPRWRRTRRAKLARFRGAAQKGAGKRAGPGRHRDGGQPRHPDRARGQSRGCDRSWRVVARAGVRRPEAASARRVARLAADTKSSEPGRG